MVKLAVVGAKNSGKTTVLEGLISYLTGRGYRIASVKHTSHSHRFDTAGKDSHRHREAGAILTVALSGGEIAVFSRPGIVDMDWVLEMTEGKFDLWLIEGDHLADHPKIIVTRHLQDFSHTSLEHIVASIGPEKYDPALPHFKDNDYEGLGSFVIDTMLNNKEKAS